eukprot:COSAG04_NODE_129_length_24418_cov_207.438217_11_plen_167_part_00
MQHATTRLGGERRATPRPWRCWSRATAERLAPLPREAHRVAKKIYSVLLMWHLCTGLRSIRSPFLISNQCSDWPGPRCDAVAWRPPYQLAPPPPPPPPPPAACPVEHPRPPPPAPRRARPPPRRLALVGRPPPHPPPPPPPPPRLWYHYRLPRAYPTLARKSASVH